MKSKILLTAALLFAGPFSRSAFAQESGLYVQLTGGPSLLVDDTNKIRAAGFNPVTVDKSSIGYSARVGYIMTPGLGVEAGYNDSGYLNLRGFNLPGSAWSANVHITNWTLAAVARAPVTDKLVVTVRGGLLRFSDKWESRGAVIGFLPAKERGYRPVGGLGFDWKIIGGLSAAVAADYYPGPQEAIGLTGGVRFAF